MTSRVRPFFGLLGNLSLFAAPQRNMVFVLSDNQRYYEMDCLGHELPARTCKNAICSRRMPYPISSPDSAKAR